MTGFLKRWLDDGGGTAPARQNHGSTLRCENLEDRLTPAKIITVDNPSDGHVPGKVNLREAILDANTSPNGAFGVDVINFDSKAFDANNNWETVLNSPLPQIIEGLTIQGLIPGVNRPLIRSVGDYRVFDVAIPGQKIGEDVFFEGLQIQDGNPTGLTDHGGGIRSVNADLKVRKCLISGNVTSGDGGGVWATGSTCKVEIMDCTVTGNEAVGRGGGIAVSGVASFLVQDETLVEGNEAGTGGGGIAAFGCPSVTLDSRTELVSIRNNTTWSGDGGGILVIHTGGLVAPPLVDLKGVSITENKAYGMVAADDEGHTMVIGGRGGGIAVFGPVRVDADTATVVSDNGQMAAAPTTAPFKLGVYLDPAVLVISNFPANAVVEDNYQFTP